MTYVIALFDDNTFIIQEMYRSFPLCYVDFGEMNADVIKERGLQGVYHTQDKEFAFNEAPGILMELRDAEVPL